MGLLPKNESLKLDCLTNNGIYTKFVKLNNIIPVCHEEYRAVNKRVLYEAPIFVDNEMIYYNINQEEFYVFDTEGEWDEKNLEHPLLSLEKRFNEKLWFDHFALYK